MKKILFLLNLLAVLVFTIMNCGDDGSPVKSNANTPMEGNSHPCGEFYVCAKVENASKYNNVVEVKVIAHDFNIGRDVELASSNWKDGGFTIELPKTLDSSYFTALIRGSGWTTRIVDKPSTLTISNENVKILDVYFAGIDKNGSVIATFSPVKTNEDGSTEAIFTYVDSDVTISGSTQGWGWQILAPDAPDDTPDEFRKTTTYLVELKKGWNVWFFSRSETITDRIAIIRDQWSTTPISGLKWRGSEENLWRFQN
jgi:hypothetical protein